MELLRGLTLREEIKTAGTVSPARCSQVLIPVCGVLEQIHDLGMVHRDIKPANIFLHEGSAGEVVKVLDFGIVRMLSRDVGRGAGDRQIRTDTFEGSPSYASPERLAGDPFDEKSDIYSLGVILYEMLVGRRPFHEARNPIQLIALVAQGHIQPLREVDETISPHTERLVSRALHSEPSERPSAAMMAEALASFLPEAKSSR